MPNTKVNRLKMHMTRCGNTLFVYDDTTKERVEKQIMRRMEKGETVERPDGTKIWIEYEAVRDASKSGSACYTWDKSGNRCKHEKVMYTLHPLGVRSRDVLRSVWRDYD
jgi:hypothetical protein